MRLSWLDPSFIQFPETSQALDEPNGLLAAGGALTPEWLLAAYQRGIFPWFNEGDPILWWTPSPRMVIYPHQLHISRSLRKQLKKADFRVSINTAFNAVIDACSAPREQSQDLSLDDPSVTSATTWISPSMASAYNQLHYLGYAHSIEIWQTKTSESPELLVGGLYGIALGKVFFGESMFSRATNGSKIALVYLVEHLKQWQYKLIDCQVYNDHLSSLGAIEIDRYSFEQALNQHIPPLVPPKSSVRREEWQSNRDITFPGNYWLKGGSTHH